MIDFGAWASEGYRMPTTETPDPGDEPADPFVDDTRDRP